MGSCCSSETGGYSEAEWQQLLVGRLYANGTAIKFGRLNQRYQRTDPTASDNSASDTDDTGNAVFRGIVTRRSPCGATTSEKRRNNHEA